SSVKVVSPFLSPSLVKKLIKLKEKNIDVNLITTNKIEDFYGSYKKNIYSLIEQNRDEDKKAIEIRTKWKKIARVMLYVWTFLFISTISISYYIRNIKMLYAVIPLAILLFSYLYLKNKIKNKRIYNYTYSKLFPFKVYLHPDKEPLNDKFIHGK